MITMLAEAVPGTHPTITVCHISNFICTFNYDTLISSGLAILVTLAIGIGVAFTLRRGTPHRLQMVFELLLGYIRNLTSETVDEDAAFILPLAATIFFFILFANWLDFFPLVSPLEPANADINLTLAMAITRAQNEADVTRGALVVRAPAEPGQFEIAVTPRIGITQCAARPLRFFIRGNRFVSRA